MLTHHLYSIHTATYTSATPKIGVSSPSQVFLYSKIYWRSLQNTMQTGLDIIVTTQSHWRDMHQKLWMTVKSKTITIQRIIHIKRKVAPPTTPITDCTGGCHVEKPRCSKRRKSRKPDDLFVSEFVGVAFQFLFRFRTFVRDKTS